MLMEGILQYFHNGFVDFILEIVAEEYIQQWVQTAVNEGQAGGSRDPNIDVIM